MTPASRRASATLLFSVSRSLFLPNPVSPLFGVSPFRHFFESNRIESSRVESFKRNTRFESFVLPHATPRHATLPNSFLTARTSGWVGNRAEGEHDDATYKLIIHTSCSFKNFLRVARSKNFHRTKFSFRAPFPLFAVN